jgi:site-specific DNA-methyltransferase (adenine-specific)
MVIKLYQGDCLEIMPVKIPDKSIDMILCDLPYGTTACKWDVIIPFEPLWKEYKRIIKDRGCIALFGSEPFSSYLRMSNIKQFKYDWIWVKTQPSGIALANKRPMKYTEMIHVFSNGQTQYHKIPSERWSYEAKKVVVKGVQGKHHTVKNGAILNVPDKRFYDSETVNPKDLLFFNSVPNGGGHKLHPTQKPVDLLEYLIKTYTLENETVLDNCMGSGSTGVACVNTGRNFIGIEKDETYFNIAKKRIEEAEQNKKEELFK